MKEIYDNGRVCLGEVGKIKQDLLLKLTEKVNM